MHNGYHGTTICDSGDHGPWEDSPDAREALLEAERDAAEFEAARILDMSGNEIAGLRAEVERLRDSELVSRGLYEAACKELCEQKVEIMRLCMELDSTCNAEELRKTRAERDAAKAEVERLRDALALFASQHRCGCGHPACTRCADDRIAAAALGTCDILDFCESHHMRGLLAEAKELLIDLTVWAESSDRGLQADKAARDFLCRLDSTMPNPSDQAR